MYFFHFIRFAVNVSSCPVENSFFFANKLQVAKLLLLLFCAFHWLLYSVRFYSFNLYLPFWPTLQWFSAYIVPVVIINLSTAINKLLLHHFFTSFTFTARTIAQLLHYHFIKFVSVILTSLFLWMSIFFVNLFTAFL